MRKLELFLSVVLATLVVSPAAAAPPKASTAATLKPAVHGDFGHYTFALTWQPGICGTDEGCQPDQPRNVLIGLHGLWASRPQSLIAAGIARQQWWSRGCDYYRHSDAAPPLAPALERRLAAVMPHFQESLLTHEYDKHVQCFGFDPATFFTTELAMREAVVRSGFGRYLAAHAGRDVAHADVVRAFQTAFSTPHGASLQLQCERDARGREVLTQTWITILANRLAAFPRPESLIDSPVNQDTCPAAFHIPAWSEIGSGT